MMVIQYSQFTLKIEFLHVHEYFQYYSDRDDCGVFMRCGKLQHPKFDSIRLLKLSEWSAWVRRLKLWRLTLRQLEEVAAWPWCGGIVHPHCATLGQTLTDEWPDMINSLSCWFWGVWGTFSASRTTCCTAGDFNDTRRARMWHKRHFKYDHHRKEASWFHELQTHKGTGCWASFDLTESIPELIIFKGSVCGI